MPIYLIGLLIVAALAITLPQDRFDRIVRGLTLVDAVACHLAPSVKSDVGSREGDGSPLLLCGDMAPSTDKEGP
jgi:hypothetical protein